MEARNQFEQLLLIETATKTDEEILASVKECLTKIRARREQLESSESTGKVDEEEELFDYYIVDKNCLPPYENYNDKVKIIEPKKFMKIERESSIMNEMER